jgi:hypothetical protein
MPQLWVKRLLATLRRQPIISALELRGRHLRVDYQTGVVERYWYGAFERPTRGEMALVAAEGHVTQSVNVVRQFEADLVGSADEYGHHWALPLVAMRKLTLIDKMLLANRLALALTKIGYNGKHHPRTLQLCWQKISAVDKLHCFQDGIFQLAALRPALAWTARPIVEHFFELSQCGSPTFQEAFQRPVLLYKALKKILLSQRTRLNTTNLYRVLGMCGIGPKIIHPSLFIAILHKMAIRGPVLDLQPGLGTKAMACALLNLPYLTYPNEQFDAAMAKGFGEFIGLQHRRYQPGEDVALALADNNFCQVDYKQVLAETKNAKCLLAFCPLRQYASVVRKHRPRLAVKVVRRPSMADYVLLW